MKTQFAGLELKNPIIAASCNKTGTVEQVVELEQAGVAAVVLKSLFEENITNEANAYIDNSTYTEGQDYLELYVRNGVLEQYITLIKECKKRCSIPIIASINCYSDGEWSDFAHAIQDAGADALELNVMTLMTDPMAADGDFEALHLEIVRQVRKVVHLPLIVKLGSNLSNPLSLIGRMGAMGCNAVVMFNRMYQTDINVDTLKYAKGKIFSVPEDLSLPLRWIAIASNKVRSVNYALSGGIHYPEDMIKAILVGASAVEICSVLYLKGNRWVSEALQYLAEWMKFQGFSSIDEFKGLLNSSHQMGEEQFMRTQFLKTFESAQ